MEFLSTGRSAKAQHSKCVDDRSAAVHRLHLHQPGRLGRAQCTGSEQGYDISECIVCTCLAGTCSRSKRDILLFLAGNTSRPLMFLTAEVEIQEAVCSVLGQVARCEPLGSHGPSLAKELLVATLDHPGVAFGQADSASMRKSEYTFGRSSGSSVLGNPTDAMNFGICCCRTTLIIFGWITKCRPQYTIGCRMKTANC